MYAYQKKMSEKDIKNIRMRLKMTQKEFAEIVNVTSKTVERWESGKSEVSGPITVLLKFLNEDPMAVDRLKVPDMDDYPMRLNYFKGDELCTSIDIDEVRRRIRIKNYTSDWLSCAFGRNEHPDFAAYETFLESRCFPRERDKMKLMLKELNLPFYDPFMIVEKTGGRLEGDDYRIEIIRRKGNRGQ